MSRIDSGIAALVGAALVGTGALVGAASSAGASEVEEHLHMTPDQIEWGVSPAMPPGGEIAILQGNPAEEGPITLRIRWPANYIMPPHFHPANEHVTVLEGRFYIGMGEEFDEAKGMELPVGTFVAMPARQPHFAFTKDEPVYYQMHSTGPFGITFVNPADDPRNQ